jgi:pyruvate formate lyase activating enzyme
MIGANVPESPALSESPGPEGRFFSETEPFHCDLCPRHCLIPPGGRGSCGVRENRGGNSHIPRYGYVSALARDPIEKKPLYHFRPGSSILSLGFVGCNLHCPFCQNWHITQSGDGNWPQGRYLKAEDVIALALEDGVPWYLPGQGKPAQIAYTYSEPLVHPEFLLDCINLAREEGVSNVLVTNGCVNAEAAAEIIPLLDAVNVDLKCFSRETYRDILGGDLDAVLAFISASYEAGVHVELTTLMVPGMNDSDAEMDSITRFIADLGAIPWHLSAYHPDWHWDAPPTSPAALLRAVERARKVLPYVYGGNIPGEENETPCPHCGSTLIRRQGYQVDTGGLAIKAAEPGRKECYCCASCGEEAPVI